MTGLELSLHGAARVALALLLLAAAAGKLRAPAAAGAGLSAAGVAPRAALPLALALALLEAVLGTLVLLGIALHLAAAAAAALGLVFAGGLLAARARGLRRLPCGCFGGARERSASVLAARALLLAALGAFVAAGGRLPLPDPSPQALLAGAVVLLTLAVAVLAALVLALYRQVGLLALRLAPQGALEIEEEGPALGADAPPLPGLERRGSELVFFSSPGCRLCHSVLPSVRALAREGLALRVADEEEEPETFRRWNVPGTPFAVHVVDGRVAAKGLVNTLEQLESVLEAGHSRVGRAA